MAGAQVSFGGLLTTTLEQVTSFSLNGDAAVVCLLCRIEPIIMSAGEVSCSVIPE